MYSQNSNLNKTIKTMTIRYIARILFISTFFIWAAGISGQNPMALYFMETIPQTSQINPAMQPRANGFFALPSVNEVFQSDLAFKDVFQDAGSEWVTLNSKRFNYNKLFDVLGSTANFNEYADVNLLGFGFRTGKGYFTFSLSERVVIQSGIPSDLIKIGDRGFADNSHFDLSTMRQKGMAYTQILFGYSHQLSEKLTLGANIKPLFGQVGFMSEIDKLSLYTGRNEWKLVVDGSISASLPIDVESTPGEFPDDIEAKDLETEDYINYGTSFSNPGLAADFGAVYKFDDRWTFSAALNNLGYIKWNKDLNNLTFNGTYAFDGISINASNRDSLDEAFDEILDSIKNVVNFNTTHDKFSSGLTPSFYLGTSYHINPSISLGLLSRSTFQKKNFRQDFSLSANIQPYNSFALNFNVSQRIKGSTFAGLGLTFLMGPLQFYILTDHLPLRYSEVDFDGDKIPMSKRLKDVTVMTGLNFVFGKNGYQDKPMLKR
jgi:hypothetical protein